MKRVLRALLAVPANALASCRVWGQLPRGKAVRNTSTLKIAAPCRTILSVIFLLFSGHFAFATQVTPSMVPDFTMDNGVGLPLNLNDSTKYLYSGFTFTYPLAFTATNVILHTCGSEGMRIVFSQGSNINDRTASPVLTYGTATSTALNCANGNLTDVTGDAYAVTYDFGGPVTFQANVQIYAQFIATTTDGNVNAPYPYASGLVGAGLNYPVSELQFCYNFFCGAPSWGYSAPTPTGYSAAFRFTSTSAPQGWLWPIQESDQDSRQGISQDYAEFGSVVTNRHHTGLDIPRPLDTPVIAVEDGAIVELQFNDSAKPACTKITTKDVEILKRICGDHGLGNALTIKHTLLNDSVPIYSTYLHLNGFYAKLADQVTNNCTLKADGLRYECAPDANGLYPVNVRKGDIIGRVGGTGYGRTFWPIHLHFEVQRFGSLLNSSFGYSQNHPDSVRYIDPVQLLEGSSLKGRPVVGIPALIPRMLARPTIKGVATTASSITNNFLLTGGGAAKRIGPRMDYSCHVPDPLNLPSPLPHPAFPDCIPLALADEFIVLQTNPATPGCSLGWIQVVPNTRDVSVTAGNMRTDGYFPIGDLSQTGTNSDAWICRGDNNVEWIEMLRTADNFLLGDVNKDGVINQADVDRIFDGIPFSTTKMNPREKCTSSLPVGGDVRDLNGDGKVDWADLEISVRLCSPLCSIPAIPKCP